MSQYQYEVPISCNTTVYLSGINKEIDDVEITIVLKKSNEEIEELTKVDGAGGGMEVRITDEINNDTRLDAYKGPTKFEERNFLTAEISPASENAGNKDKNNSVIEI